MATYTTNYNLEKPDASDPFGDFRQSYNDNMDIIDQNLGGGGGSSTLAGLSDVDINAPADGESLVYDSNSQKWVNGNVSGGGGGILLNQTLNFVGTTATITDSRVTADSRVFVYYHDTSLDEALACGLDADTSANTITFEANTAPQGTIVCDIVIDGGVGNGFIGIADCYSTEEKEVGCWIDGKPIYQKTFHFNSTIYLNGNAWTNDINVDTTNVETLVDSEVLRTIGAYSYYGYLQVVPNSNNLLNIFNCRNLNMEIDTITLWYTKTTDTAGSGTWIPSGEPSHHYSTNEQVVGTWLGQTLYEKTVNCGALPNTAQKLFAHGIANIDKVVKVYGVAINGSVTLPLPYSTNTASANIGINIPNNTEINLFDGSDRTAFTAYVTIQYTKTS